jgi:hypothetical protein
MQSTHDREAKRIKQWVEFLIVIFGLAAILALVYSDGWVLVPLAAIFAWELWNVHKDAMALDESRQAEQRYQAWRETQRI